MGDECGLKETNSTEDTVNSKQALPVIEVINERGEKLSDGDGIPKPKVPVSLPNDEIITAQKDESEPSRSPYPNQEGYAQTPYYQQQQVAGQPVYVQGRPPPSDAARMPTLRPRHNDYDYRDDASVFNESFDDMVIRNRFVQRVYTILTVQLVYTCGFIALCIFTPSIKKFILTTPLLLIMSSVVLLVVMFALTCCVSARRNFPLNFILLGIFTITFAYMMAITSAMYSTFIVISSMGITAGICLLISIFACQTSCDITNWGIYLCMVSIAVAIFGLIAIIVAAATGNNFMFFIYAIAIALLFSVYLMYDTQLIMGGRRVELSPEEYIYGALCLYVDIMEIFWAMLRILGMFRN